MTTKKKVEILERDKVIRELIGSDESLEEHILQAKHTSQAEALIYMLAGYNVFLSGPAGSGKSWVIQKFQDLYNLFYPNKRLAITSTTGTSANRINGKTIHSWSGLGISTSSYEDDIKKPPAHWYHTDNIIRFTSCLIIDEVSMLSDKQFEYVLKRIRSLREHGTQIIVSGDFTQLPPVEGEYCYGTEEWNKCNFLHLYLDKNYRAKDDKEFADVLQEISIGNGYNSEIFDKIKNIKTLENDGKPIMRLFSTNKAADKVNSEMHRLNKGKLVKNATTYGKKTSHDKANSEDLNFAKRCNVDKELALKAGDTVMVTSNQNNSELIYSQNEDEALPLRNGSIGKFFIDKEGRWAIQLSNGDEYAFKKPVHIALTSRKWRKAKEQDSKEDIIDGKILEEKELASFNQYPLKLAYAITMHKSQGQTFSDVAIDLSRCWCENLGYVALSRAQTLNGLRLVSKDGVKVNNLALAVSEASIEIKKQIMEESIKVRKLEFKEALKKFNKHLDEEIEIGD